MSSLDRVLAECVDEFAGVFGSFYHPFLAEYAEQLAKWDADWEDDAAGAVDLTGVAGSLLRSAMQSLTIAGSRTLIAAFRGGGGYPEPLPSSYHAFHAWAASDRGRSQLLAALPELSRLLWLVARRHLAHAQRVMSAAWEDREHLGRELGVAGRITSLVPGLGDTHRGGQTVCVVHWDNGVRAVYKPHQNHCQNLLTAVRTTVDPDGCFFGPLHPRSWVLPTHVWQEHVQQADVDPAIGAAGYFRRFGRVAALLTMLGAHDLHHENVIATAGGPVIVDAETLVSFPMTAEVGAASPLVHDLDASVLRTLLFPTRFSGGKLDIDLSALGRLQPGESGFLDSFAVVDAGTDEIRYDRAPVVVEQGPSMATVAGERADPHEWVTEITAGYHEARETLRRQQDEIEHAVEGSTGWGVRQILRPTYVYGRFIESSTHPTYLGGKADRQRLLDKLPEGKPGVSGTVADVQRAEELRALLDLEVPLFDVECDSRDLHCNGQHIVHGAVAMTPKQAALANLARFFARPVGRDLAYIRYSVVCAEDDVWAARGSIKRDESRLAHTDTVLADRREWESRLSVLAVLGEKGPTWLAPQLEGERLALAPVNSLLYEGGGTMLYLAQSRNQNVSANADREIDVGAAYAQATQHKRLEATTPLSLSPFTGELSALVTGLELQLCGVELPCVLPTPEAPAGRFAVGQAATTDFDYLNGLGGYLVYLSEYAGQELPGLEAEPLSQRLVDLDGPPEVHKGELGLAHGRFGRIAALSGLLAHGRVAPGPVSEHLERFATNYLRARWTDEALHDRITVSAWCKGYAGVAFALAKLLPAIGYSPADIRAAITPEVEQVVGAEIGSDISFCHGISGRLAVLCWLAERLDWPELRSEAEALNTKFIDGPGSRGWACGIGSMPDLPDFLFGLSGWHYVQLMLSYPQVALPRCLGGS